jgi:hypothetical protein
VVLLLDWVIPALLSEAKRRDASERSCGAQGVGEMMPTNLSVCACWCEVVTSAAMEAARVLRGRENACLGGLEVDVDSGGPPFAVAEGGDAKKREERPSHVLEPT